jgi:hypothetical protein
MENYNDVIWPHQSFRSYADIKIEGDSNDPSAVYVPNPVGQANIYPQLFTCINFGFVASQTVWLMVKSAPHHAIAHGLCYFKMNLKDIKS